MSLHTDISTFIVYQYRRSYTSVHSVDREPRETTRILWIIHANGTISSAVSNLIDELSTLQGTQACRSGGRSVQPVLFAVVREGGGTSSQWQKKEGASLSRCSYRDLVAVAGRGAFDDRPLPRSFARSHVSRRDTARTNLWPYNFVRLSHGPHEAQRYLSLSISCP